MSLQTKNVRVRIAPSPTGYLHIGTARTALTNWLFAQQNNGVFVLRIEDTDKERSKQKYEESIIDGLKWLGIDWQEGPDIGGDFGPYRQSERTAIYTKYIQKLIDNDKIYKCFCSTKELDEHRKRLMKEGKAPIYSGKCRELSDDEIEKNISEKKTYVFRFKTPDVKVKFEDMLRGQIEQEGSGLGDMVLAKSITEPLYNLACVIDDYEMKISHVIRGEDHIPNTPKQILIAQALGIESPKYLHLPLILAPDKSKMSKRYGSVAMVEYQEQGYLPAAIINFLALLGWNPGDEREIFSADELIKEFSIERMHKSGAVFNIVKLDWLNGHYIRNMTLNELTELCVPYLTENGLIVPLWGQNEVVIGAYKMAFDVIDYQIPETGEKVNFAYLSIAVGLYQERLKKLSEISELVDFLFKAKLEYAPELLIWKDMDNRGVANSLDTAYKLLDSIKQGDWASKKITNVLMKETDKTGDRGGLLWPLRVALSGKKASAGPFEIASALGKNKTLKRIEQAKAQLKKK